IVIAVAGSIGVLIPIIRHRPVSVSTAGTITRIAVAVTRIAIAVARIAVASGVSLVGTEPTILGAKAGPGGLAREDQDAAGRNHRHEVPHRPHGNTPEGQETRAQACARHEPLPGGDELGDSNQ